MEFRRRLRARRVILLATAVQLLATVFGVSILLQSSPAKAAQTVPYMINFQGRLTDNSGNALADGLYNVKFRLWTLASGGSNAWEGDRVRGTSDYRIQVTNGLFNIQFGDTTQGDPALSPTIFSNGTYPLYLEVELPSPATATCATNGCASFTEGAMTPRQPLASTPYAFNSDTLDGLDSSAFGQLAASNTFTGANIFTPTSGVGITVRAATSTHSLDVKDSSGSIQAYFDASGILNVGQTIQATAGTVDLGTSGSTFRTGYFGTSVQTPALNASTTGGTVTTNLGTLQRTSSGTTTIDLKDAGNTILAVTNSGGGVAGISATGGLTIGTGKVITVGATAGTGVTCTSGQILDAITTLGGVVTGGTCIAAGGGDRLASTWTSTQATTATNTQTTINFTGTANSAPSFNNGTHVLTLPSNASKVTIETKAGGGGGGSVGTTSAVKAAGGGGEGGDSKTFVPGPLAANYYFIVGGGGAGGASGGTNTGTTGSSSCFGTNAANACTSPLASGVGGLGGVGVTTAIPVLGGAGGAAASGVGDVKASGAAGGNSVATATTGIESGNGGGNGGGVGFAGAAAASAGNPGTSGGGGSGAIHSPAAVTSHAGGNGGDGYVVITVYTTVAGTGNPATLQTAYDNSTNPEIVLSGSGLTVRDSSGGLGANLFEVQDNTGATNYLAVTTAGVSTSGVLSANTTNTINSLSINAGALSGVTGYNQASGTYVQSYSAATATSAHALTLTNTNAAAGVTMQGFNITPANTTAPSSGTNVVNALNFAAGTLTVGAANTTNGINFASTTGYTNLIQSPTLDVSALGDDTTAFTQLNGTSTTNGAGTSSTSLILTSATNFDVGNYVQVNDTNCGGSGVNPCYAKITAIVSNTLTITPALTWTTGKTVNEFHLPEIGGSDLTQALANRYGRGYFISGVATGNGTTYYTENGIDTSLSSLSIGNSANVTGLTLGNSATTLTIPGSLTVTGSITAPSTGSDGYLSRAGTTLQPTNAGDSLTTTGNIFTTGSGTITSAGAITGTSLATSSNGTINSGSGTISTTGALNGGTSTLASNGALAAPVLNFTGTPFGGATAGATSLVQFGGAISGGNVATNGGTYLGLNIPAASAGSAADFLNFQKNNTVEFKVDNSGNGTLGGGFTVGTGSVAAFSSAGLFQNAAVDSTVTYSNLQKVGTISTGTWQGTNVGVLYGGTGQTTYTDGQLLIGNTTGNTLTKATLTGTANRLSITNGGGSITLNVDATQFPSAAGANTILKSSGANAASWVANTATNVCSDCAVTTLSNVGSTSIGAALVASANNTQNLGAAATVWQNVFAGNVDAGTTTTALTVGTAATTTAVTIGRSGVAVSIPGGITSSSLLTTSGNISTTGSGTITAAGAITAPTATNTINSLVINAGALSGITGYTQSSGTLSLSSATSSGNILSVSDSSLATSGANLGNLAFTNANASITSTTISGLSITPTGTTNTNVGANKLNALSFPNVSTVANNAFYGLNFGTGYDDLLRYNGAQLISGTGILQSAAVSGAYSGITGTGALASGSLATGFTTVAATVGGTGQSLYAVGDLLYASTTTALAKLSDVTLGQCLISGGTNTAPSWGSCGSGSANTTLSNLGTTSINASLTPNANNSLDLGAAGTIWKNLYAGNIDAGTTTTALTVGTAATTTAITIGRSGLQVGIPGGLTTSGSAIATANGNLTLGSGNITSTGTIGAGAITGTSLATSSNGTINSGSGTISTTGALNGGTQTLASNGAAATPVLNFTGTPLGGVLAAATTSLVQFGGTIAGGNQAANGGTYLGLNLPAASTGSAADFLNFQKNGTVEFKVDNSGNGTLGGGFTVGTGSVVAFSSAGLFQNAAVDSTVTYSNLQKVGTISTGTWQGTAVGVLYGGTGQTTYTDGQLLIGNTTGNTLTKATLTGTANRLSITNGGGSITLNVDTTQFPSAGGANTILKSSGANAASWVANTASNICSDCALTTLSNVGSTSIGAALVASANNTQNLGAAATVWQNVFAGNIDAGTTTTALTVGTAGTTTAITIGRSGLQVGIPGGLTTSGGAIATANGNLTLGSGNITSTGTIGAGAITGTSLATSSNGTINSGSGTISTTGALNGGTSTLASNGALSTPVLNFTGTPFGGATAGTTSFIQFGGAIASGNVAVNGGTYLGLNLPAASTGSAADFLNFQKNNTVEFKVDNSGNGTLGGGFTVGTGSVAAFSSAGLFQNAAVDSTVTYSNLQKVGTIGTGTWQGTAIGVLYGGTGQTTYTDGQLLIGNTTGNTLTKATLTGTANRLSITNGGGSITLNVDTTQFPSAGGANTILKSSGANAASWVANTATNICSDCAVTTLNNVGSTSIGAALVASANNTQNLGAAATVWQNVYVGNIDAGTTTTALTVGTAGTTTAITIGRSGLQVGIPGGLTTSGSAIATANGNLTLGSGNITSTGTIGAGAITGTSLATSSNGTINSGSGTISTTGALNGGTQTLASNGALASPVLNFTGTPFGGATAGASSLIQIGGAISGGNVAANGGTYLGLNLPAASAGSAADFLNFQKNNTLEFKVDNSGNGTLGGGLTVGTGAVAAFSSAGLFQNAAVDSTVTYSNLQKVGTIGTGTWQGTAVGVLYGGTGQTTYTDGQLLIGNTTGNTLTKATLTGTANRLSITNGGGSITLNVDATQFPSAGGANTILKSSGANAASWVANTATNICSDCAVTTLNNVGSTSIGAALVASANNTQNLGAAATVWQNVFVGNIDAGTTTTALTVGTAGTTTAITIGRSGLQVGIPGGLTTSGSAIATANGNLTLGSGNITSTGTIGAGAITGTSLATSSNGTINSGSGTISTTGALNGGTQTLASNGAAAAPVLSLTGTPLGGVLAAATTSLVQLGGAIAGGNQAANGGTYLGLNLPGASAGSAADFLNFQKANTVEFKVDNSGNGTIGGGITVGTGAVAAFSTAGLLQNAAIDSTVTYTNLQKIGTIGTGVWQGTAVAAQYGGTGVNGAAAGNGTLLIGNGAGYTLTTLTGTANRLGVVNTSGAITLNVDATQFPSAAGANTILKSSGANAASWVSNTGANICSDCLIQAPSSTATNTISPTGGTTGLTVNGSATATVAFVVAQSAGAAAANFNVTGGTQTDGVLINRTTAGVLTNAFNITNTSGTVTNGIVFNGTIGTDIARGAGILTLSGAGGATISTGAATNVNLTPGTSGTVVIGGTTPTLSSGSTITLQAGGAAQNVLLTPSTTGTVVVGGTAPTVTTSGAVALKVDTGAAAALSLGTVNASSVAIGNATAGTTVAIQGGTNAANAVTITAAANGGIAATTTGTGQIALNTASKVLVQSSTDSATTFQVQNAAGSTIFNINTTDTNPLSKSGFETATLTPWANLTGGTLVQDLTQQYVGFASGKVTAGTSTGGGISQPITLTNGTQYTLSFYAKLDAASAALTTLQAGYSNTGLAGGEVDCGLNSTTVVTAGWTRYSCTFVAGSPSGTPYIYIEHNDTTSEVFYVDAVQIDTGSFATPYGSGQISLNANINSPVNFQEGANSTTAFQITNTAGLNILNVDTLNNNQNNQASNPSLETGTTGWAAKTGCTLTQDVTTGYNGTSSAKCVNTATANAGMNMTGIVPVMVNGTTYTLSLYAKASANMSTLELGRSDTGLIANDTACLTAQTVTSGGWKRLTCTFTPGAQSGTPYVYIRQTDATVRTIWVDAVTLETDANASTNYRDGRISLGNATISSPAVFQTNTNSTTAFQIQNAAGIQVFNIDTASDTNLVGNPGFEVNSVGWSVVAGATNLIRDTSKTYVGIASGKVTTAVTSGSGMRYTFGAALPAVTGVAYTISAYVESSVADSTFTMGYNNGADVNCTVAPAASATVPTSTGWTRFTCSTPVTTTVNSIYITSGTTAVTLNVDAVRVELGATATAYGAGNISFNGVFTSPITVRNPNDNTTEFQVQNAASTNLFAVDSLNATVNVGVSGAVATAGFVNLGTSTGATQDINIGSTGLGNAAAGTLVSIQGGTTVNTAVVIGTNGAGGITIDSGTTGNVNLGTGANGKTITIGSTNTSSVTNVQGGTGGSIGIGSTVGNNPTLASTVNIANTTNATAVQTIGIGSNANVGNIVVIDAGTTAGKLDIGNSTTAHVIRIAAGGAAAGSVEAITIGSNSTTSASVVTLQAGSSPATSGSGGIYIGSPTTDTQQVNLQLDSFSTFGDAGTCTTAINQGALYYNTNTNAIRSCVNGGWEDVVTTAGMGIMLFGVVADSGANPGDLASITSTNITNGPCKVSAGVNLQTVSWTACTVYSGGRKSVVTAGTAGTTNGVVTQFQHLCIDSTTGQPALSTAGAETANLNTKSLDPTSALTLSNPKLCLADIKFAAANNTITDIYDTRTFTSSEKAYVTSITTAPVLGQLVRTGTTTPGSVAATTLVADQNIEGVVVATTGATSTTAINAIIAVSGPAYVKAITGTNVIGALLGPTTTAGYAITIAAPTSTFYGVLGSAESVWTGATTCVLSKDACEGSILTHIRPR